MLPGFRSVLIYANPAQQPFGNERHDERAGQYNLLQTHRYIYHDLSFRGIITFTFQPGGFTLNDLLDTGIYPSPPRYVPLFIIILLAIRQCVVLF